MITGSIGGKQITDADIISGSLSVTMSTCGSSFAFGTFNAAVLKITIRDSDSTDFSGAKISLRKDNTNLGSYYIDESKIKRDGSVVSLTAIDGASLFDVEFPDSDRLTEFTPSTALSSACIAVGVPFTGIPQSCPNQAVTFKPSSVSVQSYRDLVMWCAQLLGANAVINRNGALDIRPAFKASTSEDYTNRASDRVNMQRSDSSVWIKYLSAYSERKPKTYIFGGAGTTGKPASVSIPLNPLLDGKSETDCDTINTAILSSVSYQGLFSLTARAVDDPSVKLGDVAKFTGGRSGPAAGIVTAITWHYRGTTTITCTAPDSVKEEIT